MNTSYKIYLEKLYILILGVITSFSLPPYNYWFLNFLTFSLLLRFLLKNKLKNLNNFIIFGYLFGFGFFASNMYWIPFSLGFDDSLNFLIPLAIILIPAFLSVFYAFAFAVFKLFINSKSIFVNIMTFSLVIGFFEYLRGIFLSGFPWNLFAYSFSENIEFIQITSLVGIYGFNTLLLTIFCLPSILYLSKKKTDLIGFSLIILITICSYFYGIIRIESFRSLETKTLSTNFKVLSTNIPIERFYSNVDGEEVLIKLIDLSNPTKNEDTIFIWPEGVIPNINLSSLKNQYDYLLKKSFSEKHTIIFGVNNDEIKNEIQKFYNSLSVIDNNANIKYKYYKNKLVPFGEFLPLENILSKIGLKTITNNYQSYSSGTERKIYKYDNNIKILPLICFEIIYSGSLSNKNDYNFIVNISEDGWFGNSIGPHQHFAHSIFRSVEYGKYTLRSANNGISAIIDPVGSIVDKLNINKEGIISIKEVANIKKTLFSTYGNKIYILIILLYIFLIFSFKKLENE